MPGISKQISNASQAFSLGATWGTPSVDNAMTTDTVDMINNTGAVLYTGDIVCMDATGTLVNQPTTATLAMALGTVGSTLELSTYTAIENINSANVTNTFPTIVGSTAGTGIGMVTTDGNVQPYQDVAWTSQTVGFTNGNTNMTDALTSTANPLAVGDYVYTPYNASTNANPQVFIVVSNGGSTGAWTAVGAVISGAGANFTGSTGSFVCQVGRDQSTKGPGWQAPVGWTNASAFMPGVVVPIITGGLGRVNVNAIATVNAGDNLLATNASFIATRVATGSVTAAQIGYTIAIAVEAQGQKDTTLTSLGITGHDSIRAFIVKV
jgi:hypothetical protein